jgi:hypothetical protein
LRKRSHHSGLMNDGNTRVVLTDLGLLQPKVYRIARRYLEEHRNRWPDRMGM